LAAMAKEDEYVANAAETLELAQRTTSPGDRRRLLRLSEAWLDLADRMRSRSRAAKPDEHPLITATFGREQPDA
jgi:hypothetical protein